MQDPKTPKSAMKKRLESWRKVTARVISGSRLDADITQQALAVKLGLSRNTVADMEAGRRKIEVGDLIMTAQALGIEPEKLFQRVLRW